MDAGRCAGKVALVTGASGGIGGAIARRLAAEGAIVAAHYGRNAAAAEALAAELRQGGGEAIAIGGDTTDPTQCAAISAAVVERFGRIDILVNNAGALRNLPFGSVTPVDFDAQFHANTLSVVLMMQAVIPHFSSSGGAVVNISTNIVTAPVHGTAIYAASKAAVNAITAGFARELAGRGIRVNAVSPGATDTAMLAWLDEDMRRGIAQATPLGRIGEPDDVASAAAFFASEDSRFITGRSLVVDGGLI